MNITELTPQQVDKLNRLMANEEVNYCAWRLDRADERRWRRTDRIEAVRHRWAVTWLVFLQTLVIVGWVIAWSMKP